MNLPNVWRIFATFRTEEEEREYSRKAFFYLLAFLGSAAVFSFVGGKQLR